MSSNNLDKYECLTGEDLDLKPSTVEQARFEYSPLVKVFNKGLDKEDKKEGLLKRLENTEKNQNKNNNDNDKSELSTETITSDDEIQTFFEYLKNNIKKFFDGYPEIFYSNLKTFFEHIASEETKYIDYDLLSRKFFITIWKCT